MMKDKSNHIPITEKGVPNPVDVHVGQRIRARRSLMGISQEKLAMAVNLTFQQIQKYERGANRVSASRLYQFGKILNVPVAYFFEQYGEPQDKPVTYGLSDNDQESFAYGDILHAKETLDLIRVYYSIPDPQKRKDLFKVIKSMAENIAPPST